MNPKEIKIDYNFIVFEKFNNSQEKVIEALYYSIEKFFNQLLKCDEYGHKGNNKKLPKQLIKGVHKAIKKIFKENYKFEKNEI